jgi:hypothetical protein
MKYFERLKIAANVVEALKRYGIYVVLLVLIILPGGAGVRRPLTL